jgi:hypothetical protein
MIASPLPAPKSAAVGVNEIDNSQLRKSPSPRK